jgi:FlaA1/EpsC-like NDP-sugar epimerase
MGQAPSGGRGHRQPDGVDAIDRSTVDRRARRARLDARLRRAFPAIQFAVDAFAWTVAVPVTTILRYDLRLKPVDEQGVALIVVVAIVLQGVVGAAFGLYRRRYHYGSFDEVRVLGYSVAAVSALLLVVAQIGSGGLVPRTVPVLAGFLALVIAAVSRYAARLLEDQLFLATGDDVEPIVVLGAGHSGAQIGRTLLRSTDSRYRPVAFLDDDPRKAKSRINGIRVRGTGDDALAVSRQYGATAVLVAIPSISGERLRELAAPMLDAGLRVLMLPRVSDVLGTVGAEEIRPLTIADLLGRHPADVDLDSIAGYLNHRRVLVTGAGGSIGSELCRQLSRFEPSVLFLLDRDESGLHRTTSATGSACSRCSSSTGRRSCSTPLR